MSHIGEIMSTDVETCRPEEDLAAAARRMWSQDIGCLPVVDDEGHLIGIVTDRDVCMAAFTQGKPLAVIAVSSAMARQVYACLPSDSVRTAEHLMRTHQVRRLPIIDERNHLVGILSLNDIARTAERRRGAKTTDITAEEVASTLAAVCAPRPAIVAARE